ncbi:MAG TPA: hypothetical protein VN203_22780, partial [Candidatus Acidoferrum sp.]|nr:hypothetical protein [Candidatus Acidoferrum sp.]
MRGTKGVRAPRDREIPGATDATEEPSQDDNAPARGGRIGSAMEDYPQSRIQESPPTAPAPVEAAWLRFRRGPGGDLLREALQMRASYLATIGLPRLPPEVLLPGAVPWTLLALQEARAQGAPIGARLSWESSLLA